ncbi:MAG: UDP-3-O-(3-hydroxymyristoyl)glucosamine N-acyltransferase [Pseudomonadota bacterium]
MSSLEFFPPLRDVSPRDISEALGLELINAQEASLQDALLSGVSPIEHAQTGSLSFLDNAKYAQFLGTTTAACVIVGLKFRDQVPSHTVGLVSKQPYRDFAKAAALLMPEGVKLQGFALTGGVSEAAFVDPTATIEDGAVIEPMASIGPYASVGAGTKICSGAVISHHTQIGRHCYVAANCVVQHALLGDRVVLHAGARIGQDGFGFAMGPQGHLKVPQLGRVIIQDDVDIGAGTCIDRGTTRDTIIGEGTRIDNLVQIGHNVEVGRHCVLVAQVGIAGSTVLEDFVVMGGQVGVGGHVRIGMGAQIAASASIKDDVPPGGKWAGIPAKPARQAFREFAALKRLGEEGFKNRNP